MRRDIVAEGSILIRMNPAEKEREVKRLRSAYRGGYRWVVLVLSRGGYFIRSSFFKSYFQAARLQSDTAASGVTVLITTISHLVKLMAGTIRSQLSAREIHQIRIFLFSQLGFCMDDRTLLSQCFLLKEFFPIHWKATVRLYNVIDGFSMVLNDGLGEWKETCMEFASAAAVVIQLSQVIVGREWRKKMAKGFTIYGELDTWAANVMGYGGRIALYKGSILEDGGINVASVVELVDPLGVVNLELTLIARYAGKNGEITFYDDQLRKTRLSYQGALPGNSCWEAHPIIIKNLKGR